MLFRFIKWCLRGIILRIYCLLTNVNGVVIAINERACISNGAMGDNKAKCPLHDFDIENRNRVLKIASHAVQDFNDLGISFHEDEEIITTSVVEILKRQN